MSNWIKCSDRMPDDMMDVLFVIIRDNVQKEYAIGHHCAEGWNSCFIYNSMHLSNDENIIKVTHWMELPEFPENE